MYYAISSVYMFVNVNVIYYVHVCEQARWARSAGNSATENECLLLIIIICFKAALIDEVHVTRLYATKPHLSLATCY